MALSTTATSAASLTWTQTDTKDANTRITDNGSISHSYSIQNGHSFGQANKVWHEIMTVASGDEDLLDLYSLPITIMSGTQNVDFSGGRISAIIINNTTTKESGGYLTVDATMSSGWNDPFLPSTNPRENVFPSGVFFKSNPYNGWDVPSDNRILKLYAPNCAVTAEIAIVGRIL